MQVLYMRTQADSHRSVIPIKVTPAYLRCKLGNDAFSL